MSDAMVLAADLGCALCRKRTGEAGTRLCQACGLPVHVACAQHIAARDCALEFGFPLPAVFCSKRCYDAGGSADLLGAHDHAVDGLAMGDDAAAKRWSPQVPNEVTAALTLKIGDVSRTSRKHLSITTFRFLLSEGFDVFKAKVNSRAAKELQSHTLETFVREDAAIYIRPGVHSKQAELVELSDANFETRIRKTFRNFLKRKATQSGGGGSGGGAEHFECDVYVYVKKESVAARRRGRDAVAGASVSGTSTGGGRGVGGGTGGGVKMLSGLAAQHHLMLQQQQQMQRVHSAGEVVDVTDGATLDSGPSGTKRRLCELADDASPAGYKTIRMVLNGTVVPVKVNVANLLAALGLPSTALPTGQGPPSDTEAGAASGSSLNGEC